MPELAFYKDYLDERVSLKTKFFFVWIKKMEFKTLSLKKICTGIQRILACVCSSPSIT